jgi:hypothetical protein
MENISKYISDHWAGNHSLARSLWINLLAIDIVLRFLEMLMARIIGNISLISVVIIFLIIFIIGSSINIWQFVGLWRAARKRRGFLGFMVILVIMVLSIFSILSSYNFLVLEFDLFISVLEDFLLPPSTITTSMDGHQLLFTGRIKKGDALEFKKVLDDHPNIQIINLDSPGGLVNESRIMATLTRERHLNTYVAHLCASACPIIYMAGQHRYINPSAKIGFHRYSLAGKSEQVINQYMETDMRKFQEEGVPVYFTDKIYATSAWSIWEPSLSELKAANVVTDVGSPQ